MSHHQSNNNKYVYLLQEFSIPLLSGVVVALIMANVNYGLYDRIVNGTYSFFTTEEYHPDAGHADASADDSADHAHDPGATTAADPAAESPVAESPVAESPVALANSTESAEETGNQESPADPHSASPDNSHAESQVSSHENGHGNGHGWQHFLTMHFVVNELFMVIFFGVAAKEITEACLPGGSLNPPRKALNPLMGTLGGVLGPVGAYLLLNLAFGKPEWANGWGIPTATDIALAWLVARMVFGSGHPAVSFLLLLAVADDGIGLGIIAFAYPDPALPTEWIQCLWILPGMFVAFAFRKLKVRSWVPYILFGGAFSWFGLFSAHLHPALALVPIVPFLPGPSSDVGLFRERQGIEGVNPLDRFEHDLKLTVDFGLFFFAFANAGVPFSNVNELTWIVFLSLLVGKTLGIAVFSCVGILIGCPLPTGMELRHLFVAGIVAGIGLTVALFVSGEAFTEPTPQGAAKMGALFSGTVAIIAIIAGRMLKVKSNPPEDK